MKGKNKVHKSSTGKRYSITYTVNRALQTRTHHKGGRKSARR